MHTHLIQFWILFPTVPVSLSESYAFIIFGSMPGSTFPSFCNPDPIAHEVQRKKGDHPAALANIIVEATGAYPSDSVLNSLSNGTGLVVWIVRLHCFIIDGIVFSYVKMFYLRSYIWKTNRGQSDFLLSLSLSLSPSLYSHMYVISNTLFAFPTQFFIVVLMVQVSSSESYIFSPCHPLDTGTRSPSCILPWATQLEK